MSSRRRYLPAPDPTGPRRQRLHALSPAVILDDDLDARVRSYLEHEIEGVPPVRLRAYETGVLIGSPSDELAMEHRVGLPLIHGRLPTAADWLLCCAERAEERMYPERLARHLHVAQGRPQARIETQLRRITLPGGVGRFEIPLLAIDDRLAGTRLSRPMLLTPAVARVLAADLLAIGFHGRGVETTLDTAVDTLLAADGAPPEGLVLPVGLAPVPVAEPGSLTERVHRRRVLV